MIATLDGLLIQTFIDADNAPTSQDLAATTGRTLPPEQTHFGSGRVPRA
ncbi:MAG: hypothetical protein ACLQK4_04190 [Acidimicrobiales bacterium]|jgi:hypothetical protein